MFKALYYVQRIDTSNNNAKDYLAFDSNGYAFGLFATASGIDTVNEAEEWITMITDDSGVTPYLYQVKQLYKAIPK